MNAVSHFSCIIILLELLFLLYKVEKKKLQGNTSLLKALSHSFIEKFPKMTRVKHKNIKVQLKLLSAIWIEMKVPARVFHSFMVLSDNPHRGHLCSGLRSDGLFSWQPIPTGAIFYRTSRTKRKLKFVRRKNSLPASFSFRLNVRNSFQRFSNRITSRMFWK